MSKWRGCCLWINTAALFALCASGACIGPRPLPPKSAPRSTLGIRDQSVTSKREGPLQVVFSSPSGEQEGAPEVTIVFDRPMRVLDLDSTLPQPSVLITPQPEGRWQWMGTTALRFNTQRLQPATEYRVEVPASTRALDGQTLAHPYVFTFSTQRPALIRSSPYSGETSVEPKAKVEVFFNQNISDAEIVRAIKLIAHPGARAIAFKIKRSATGDMSSAELILDQPMSLGTRFTLQVDPSLRSMDGNLSAGPQSRELSFSTVGPLKVLDLSCTTANQHSPLCSLGGGITVSFSNEVRYEDGMSAIELTSFRQEPIETWMQGSTTRTFDFWRPFEPGKTYTIRVGKKPGLKPLRDIYNQQLVAAAEKAFTFEDSYPSAGLAVGGDILAGTASHTLPYEAVNTGPVRVKAAAIDRQWMRDHWTKEQWKDPDFPKTLTIAEAPRNTIARQTVSLDDLTGKPAHRGAIYIKSEWGNNEGGKFVYLTNVGVSTKAAAFGTLLWATDLNTGNPIAQADIELIDPESGSTVGKASSDSDGLVFIPPELHSKGKRTAMLVGSGEEFSRVSVSLLTPPSDRVVLFTERGIYRPGETVHIKGIWRSIGPKGLTYPTRKKATLKLVSPTDEEEKSVEVMISDKGTFHYSFPLNRDVHVGRWSVRGSIDPDDTTPHYRWGKFYTGFQVADYHPNEFSVDASTDRRVYVRGDRLDCRVRGRYLYGGAMSYAPAVTYLWRQYAYGEMPVAAGFSFGDEAYPTNDYYVGARPMSLDKDGAHSETFDLDFQNLRTAERLECRIEVRDESRETHAATSTAVVHPAEVYVGLQAFWPRIFQPGTTFTPKVIVVDLKNKRVAQPVHLELIQRTIIHSGSPSEDGKREESILKACDVTPGIEPASCALTVPTKQYTEDQTMILRASTKDRRGNIAATSYELMPGMVRARAETVDRERPAERAPEFGLVLGQREYEAGQSAHLTIRSPYTGAHALVTVMRNSPLWTKIIAIPDRQANIDIPITPDMVPIASIGVVVVKGSSYKRGEVEIRVDTKVKRLDVKVIPSTPEARPGQTIDVAVEVKDIDGKPVQSEVALFGADEGSLQIVNYRTPDPLEDFFSRWDVQVADSDIRDQIIRPGRLSGSHQTKPPQVRMGATSVNRPRTDFRQTVLFEPKLQTNADGKLSHRFTLPEGLTSYRIMAVAIGKEDLFGSNQTNITTTKPMMLRPNLPAALRTGDSFEASVVVTSSLPNVKQVQVSAKAEGLEPSGGLRKMVEVSPDVPKEVRFAYTARHTGPYKLRFDASADGTDERDAVEVGKEVVVPALMESAALFGDTMSDAVEGLGDLSSIRPDVGGLEVSLASSPLAGMAPGIEKLIEYPYGCTEQMVSRMVPLVALRSVAPAIGVKLPSDVDRVLADTVEKVSKNQHPNGGFGYWPRSEVVPWLSAYATWGLSEAARRGVKVDMTVMANAMIYLLGEVDSPTGPQQAFILDMLASVGVPIKKQLAGAFEGRGELGVAGKAQLLHAMALGGGDKAAMSLLQRDIENSIRLDGGHARTAEVYGHDDEMLNSNVKTAAMVVRALMASSPDHRLIKPLIYGLIADRGPSGTWRTTQEATWALLALDDYRKAHPPEETNFDARAFLGDWVIADASFRGTGSEAALVHHLTIPSGVVLNMGGRSLAFQMTGKGELHYEARLRFARAKMPTKAMDGGFYVGKEITISSHNGMRVEEARVKSGNYLAGDVIRVELTVVSPQPRRFVVVDDPVAGGFEPADLGDWMSKPRYWDITYQGGRREARDDRVLFFEDSMSAGVHTYVYYLRARTIGTFSMPPTRVEEMYTPETFGTTAGRIVVVSEEKPKSGREVEEHN